MGDDRSKRFTLSSAAGLKVTRNPTQSSGSKTRVAKVGHEPIIGATGKNDAGYYVIDVNGLYIDRAATMIAQTIHTHEDSDPDKFTEVVVINARGIKLSGNPDYHIHDMDKFDLGNNSGKGYHFIVKKTLKTAVEQKVVKGPEGRWHISNLRIYSGAMTPKGMSHGVHSRSPLKRSKAGL